MARNQVRLARILIAAGAAVALVAGLLEYPAHGRSAAGATQASSAVAVVPGFKAAKYPGYFGVPPLPVGNAAFASYHFTELPDGSVTPTALGKYDTVILYGIRWGDLSASAQAAINAFAATHKVMIWDSDGTGAQSYASFIHPFSQMSSHENYQGKPNGAVVSFPTGTNFLASDNPSSPYYLEPTQLVTDRDLINDMNAMTTGTANWVPALVAANKILPNGGWPLAWSYGVIGNHTGMTIYSGIDADAFINKLNPNDAIRELALQLKAPFRQTPDPACAPNCQLPPTTGGTTHAACKFSKPVPKRWVHGRIVMSLKTSIAAGITAQIVNSSGKVIVSGKRTVGSGIRLGLQTRKLPSNRASRLRALVFVNGQQACSRPFTLRVDNVPPRVLRLTAAGGLLRIRVSERSTLTIKAVGVSRRPKILAAGQTLAFGLPGSGSGWAIISDRAGNKVVRRLIWH